MLWPSEVGGKRYRDLAYFMLLRPVNSFNPQQLARSINRRAYRAELPTKEIRISKSETTSEFSQSHQPTTERRS
jgi:hypothetical protein